MVYFLATCEINLGVYVIAGGDVVVPHCVFRDIPTLTYDLNSWAETPNSRAKVAALSKRLPLFEGYDNYEEQAFLPYVM